MTNILFKSSQAIFLLAIISTSTVSFAEMVLSEKLMTNLSFDLYADSKSDSIGHLVPKNLKGTFEVSEIQSQSGIKNCTEAKSSMDQLDSLKLNHSAQLSIRDSLQAQMEKSADDLKRTQEENRNHRTKIEKIRQDRLKIQLELKTLSPEDPKYSELVKRAAVLAEESSQLVKLVASNSERILNLNREVTEKNQEIAQTDEKLSNVIKKLENLNRTLSDLSAEATFRFSYDSFMSKSLAEVQSQLPNIETLLIASKTSQVYIDKIGTVEWNTPLPIKGAEVVCDLAAKTNLQASRSDSTLGLTFNPLFPFLTGKKVFELYKKLKTLEKAKTSDWTPVRHVVEATSYVYDYLPKDLDKSKRGKALLDIFESYYFVSRTDYAESQLVEESTLDQTFNVPEEIEFPYIVKWEFKNETP